MYRLQIPANGFNHIDCHAVASLLIRLGVRGDGKKPVDLIFSEALEPETLSWR